MKVGQKTYKKRWLIPALIVVGVIALVVLPFFSWLIGEDTLTATSDAQFCVSCHTMDPV